MISRPTRFPDNSALSDPSLLDHVFVNFIRKFKTGILHYPFSDHLPVYIHIPLPVKVPTIQTVEYREFNEQNKRKFSELLRSADWIEILQNPNNNTDVDGEAEAFYSFIHNSYNACFPVKYRQVSEKRLCNPWLTPAVLKSIKRKTNLFMDYRLGIVDHNHFKLYRNLLSKIILVAKKNYYSKIFTDSKANMRTIWKHINQLKNVQHNSRSVTKIKVNGVSTSDSSVIANGFNAHFSNIGPKLDEQLEESDIDPISYLQGNFPQSMSIPNISQHYALQIIKKLKNKCSKNDIPVSLVKSNSIYIAYPIAYIFNKSIEQGKFPSCFKKAVVTPVYKNGPKNDMGNYRPISGLNFMLKVFESIVKNHLLSFLKLNNIISKDQYGFMEGLSTFDALNSLTQHVHDSLNTKNSSICIYIDFQKAFDTVNHSILLKKLEFYGIRGNLLNWMRSYLSNRTQATIYENSMSTSLPLHSGVPQGSILGPIMFLIYINDLSNIFDGIITKLFADDSSLLLCGPDLVQLIFKANKELRKFYIWCISNRLSIHLSKTKYMIFTNKTDGNLPPLFINFKRIEQTSVHKVLGILIDDKLTFKSHIDFVCSKLAKSASLLQNMSTCMPVDILKKCYYAYVYPHMTYCAALYGNTYPTALQPLFVMQKKIVRIVSKSEPLSHTKPLFDNLKLLPLYSIIKFESCVFMYKNITKFEAALHNYNTRFHNSVQTPFPNLSLYQRSLNYVGPKLWNNLSDQIKSSPNIYTFKRRLKQSLLQA